MGCSNYVSLYLAPFHRHYCFYGVGLYVAACCLENYFRFEVAGHLRFRFMCKHTPVNTC